MAFEAVIFDFGGVFTTSPVQNFAEFERRHGLPEKFIGEVIKTNHHDNSWARFERSEMSLEDFDAAFAEETKTAGFEIRGRTLVDLLKLHFNHEMIDALGRVKAAGYKTGCITNNLPKIDSKGMLAPGESRDVVEQIHANFDHIIESSKAGVRKPEPRIYEMMCEALLVKPEACIFLDDLGVNLKPARAMGMTTVKVPIGDVGPAVEELDRLLFPA
ncbi:HAD-IA family hydrolase [Hyphococcus sp.]|uniref:HAD-IA family hydrolase n=1 Tax=Hyphococcus sp. TaxID=2038636 RepID=UPI0035C74CC0